MATVPNANKAYMLKVGPDTAGDLLSNCFIRQRKLRPRKVAVYAEKMKKGHWRPGSNIEVAILGTGRNSERILVNGQHRLNAVIESGTVQEFAIAEIACKDADEVAKLYYVQDRGTNRTPADIYSASGIIEELNVTRTQMNAIGGAIRFINDDFGDKGNPSMDEDEMLAMIGDYADAALMYIACTEGATKTVSSALKRSAVMSVGMATFRYAADVYGEKTIEEFWDGVALDDGLRQSDPRKVCHNHLVETRMPSAAMVNGRRIVGQAYQARYIANCFNTWVTGGEYKAGDGERRQRGSSKVYDANAPIKILGTPWKGSDS